ncbi:MAG: hypothetical protein R2827_16715, partial [Bdellovibrionales bacterium]
MKAINERELDLLLDDINGMAGARLTDVRVCDEQLYLIFFELVQRKLIVIDMNGKKLIIARIDEKSRNDKKQKKPITLFLKKNFLGLQFQCAKRLKQFGRVVELMFVDENDQISTIQVRLFPAGKNVIATHANGKTVSLNKVAPLEVLDSDKNEFKAREVAEIINAWETEKPSHKKSSGPPDPEKVIKKLKKSIEKIQQGLGELMPWMELGEWLKVNGHLDVPEEYLPMVDKKLSLGENINRAFQMQDKQTRKHEGALERVKDLEAEIEKVINNPAVLQEQKPGKRSPNLMDVSGAKGKRVPLKGNIPVFVNIGKSAKENLQLIRKAKPWHIWLHLRDYPGAHAIMELEKKASVDDQLLLDAAKELIQFQFRKRLPDIKGEKFDVVCAEIRHVR